MPAYENTLDVPTRVWVLLTPTAVAALRLQCQGPYVVHLKVNQSATEPPVGPAGSIMLLPQDGWTTDDTLAKLFGGALNGATTGFVWAYSYAKSSVSVNYA